MSGEKDTTSTEFRLESPPRSRKEERLAKRAAYMRQWNKLNRDSCNAIARAYRAKNRAHVRKKARDYNLAYRYGINRQQVNELLDSQGNRCAGCQTAFRLSNRDLPHVDHCHETGRVRGILCGNCNRAIGYVADSPEILRSLAQYLERSKSGP